MSDILKLLGARLQAFGIAMLTFTLGLTLATTAALVTAPDASANTAQYTFETAAQERQFRQLINELRCPKCQNQTIADSDAPLALDLRERVYQMTMEGQSREEIIEFMRARYGDFVHYKPPMNASTIILWVGPGLVLLIGFATIVMLTRMRSKNVSLNVEEQARLDALLAADEVNANQVTAPKSTSTGGERRDSAQGEQEAQQDTQERHP